MDPVSDYRRILRDLIREYADVRAATGEVEFEAIIDERHDHYELMCSGWNGGIRVHGAVIHLDIRDGKVWIQFDGTDAAIAEELVARGIPKDRIVLAFQPAELRPLTGYATA